MGDPDRKDDVREFQLELAAQRREQAKRDFILACERFWLASEEARAVGWAWREATNKPVEGNEDGLVLLARRYGDVLAAKAAARFDLAVLMGW